MSAAVDRDWLTAARTRPIRRSLLGPLALGLLPVLLALTLVHVHQFSLLRQTMTLSGEGGALSVTQAEVDYLRLHEVWHQAAEGNAAALVALEASYRAWVSRVERLEGERLAPLISGGADRQTLERAQAFIADADRTLGGPPKSETSRGLLVALRPALDELGPALHAMSLGVEQRLAEQATRQALEVRAQNLLDIGLTALLSVLMLAFAGVALRHLHQLRQQRREVEELAAGLREARRQAQSVGDATSALLAQVSRDVQTSFHGLMETLRLLRDSGLNARQVDQLRTATESAGQLQALLSDILDLGLLDGGRLTLSPARVDVRGVLREVEALMRPQASARSLALHIDAEPMVPEHVQVDASRLRQILVNLLAHAIQAASHGAVVLDLRSRAADHGLTDLEFVFTDTGMGMGEASIKHLFSPSGPAQSPSSNRHPGAGLALVISRRLAQLMGGEITVHSKPGEGNRFTLRLPVRAVDEAARSEPSGPGAERSRSLSVLVAEDHPVNRQYLAAVLHSLGHAAHFTSNGQEAVQAARQRCFDVVLMDVHMPVLDGVGATQAIRSLPDPGRSTVPIVALTADNTEETRDRCLMAGANSILTKPVGPQDLAAALRRLFGADVDACAAGRLAADEIAPTAAAASPLIDETVMGLSLQAMSRATLGRMVQDFLDQAPQTVRRLRAAVRDAQPLDLRADAHAAKGAALNLGLSGLAATAAALQEGAAHLPAHEVARLVQRFEEQLAGTREAVRALGLLGDGS